MNLDADILGVVPARSGSKGLPDKNVRELYDKPLLAWPIIQANESHHLTDVYVSTDSERYADIAREYGGEVPFLRPEHLAGDDVPIADVIVHLLDWLADERDQTYDYITLIEPTSPLRRPGDIDTPIERLVENRDRADAIVSVLEIDEVGHPYMVKELVDDMLEPFYDTDEFIYQRQQLPPLYQLDGTIYVSKTETYREHRHFDQDRTMTYHTKRWQHQEIDDIYDFVCVQALLEHVSDEVVGFASGTCPHSE